MTKDRSMMNRHPVNEVNDLSMIGAVGPSQVLGPRGMGRLLIGGMILALAILASHCRVHADSPKLKAVVLDGQDLIALGGQQVELVAKLEVEGFGLVPDGKIWRRDLKNKPVRFSFQGQTLGEAITDSDGQAHFAWTPPGQGDHEVFVRFEGDGNYAAKDGSLLVAVRDPSRKSVVLDIDHTICETDNWDLIRGTINSPPLPDAKDIVIRLTTEYDIIYVTARLNKFQDVTRRWLDHYGFPRSPVYFLDIKKYPFYQEAKYKTYRIGKIKEMLPNVVIGVGDKKTDAQAYSANGLRSIIIGDSGGVSGAEEVSGWLEIESLLFSIDEGRERAPRFSVLHADPMPLFSMLD